MDGGTEERLSGVKVASGLPIWGQVGLGGELRQGVSREANRRAPW